jgi:hypothetical protein
MLNIPAPPPPVLGLRFIEPPVNAGAPTLIPPRGTTLDVGGVYGIGRCAIINGWGLATGGIPPAPRRDNSYIKAALKEALPATAAVPPVKIVPISSLDIPDKSGCCNSGAIGSICGAPDIAVSGPKALVPQSTCPVLTRGSNGPKLDAAPIVFRKMDLRFRKQLAAMLAPKLMGLCS